MVQSKKVLIVVASTMGLLVLAPLCVLWLTKEINTFTGDTDFANQSQKPSNAPYSYGLEALQARVTALMDQDLTAAVQEKKVSLQTMAHFEKLLKNATLAMQQGRWDQARQGYQLLEHQAGAELERLRLLSACAEKEQTLIQMLGYLEPFQALFEKTYQQVVANYDQAKSAVKKQEFDIAIQLYNEAIDQANSVRGHADAHLDALLDSGKSALGSGDFRQADQHFRSALKLVPEIELAKDALREIEQLRSVESDLQRAKAYEIDRQWEAALTIWEPLLQRYPDSGFIRKQFQHAQKGLLAAQIDNLLQQAELAQAANDVPKAIELLSAADKLQPSAPLQARLRRLKAQLQAQELDQALQAAFQLLEIGQYAKSRQIYADLKSRFPQNPEVQTGLEQASRLNLANINYQQNIRTSERYYADGKFPLAIQFYNAALASRPSHLNAADRDREVKLDARLKIQLQSQFVDLLSDGRTHVSVVGVFAPIQLERKRLSLQPDVYQIRGERVGYQSVEFQLKLNAEKSLDPIRVVCVEKL